MESCSETTHQQRECIEVIDIGNAIIRKDTVLAVLNKLEKANAGNAEVAEEFGLDEFLVDLIKQKKEVIIKG